MAEPAARRYLLPWYHRALAALSSYLPLLLMALLALATLWLVKNTPTPQSAKSAEVLRHVPDTTMRNFTVQRFAPNGTLRLQLAGTEGRHYPDTDTMEVDNPRIRSIGPDARVTVATAQKAVSNGDASEVQLSGAAHVVREASVVGGQVVEAINFKGEFLHAFLQTEQVRSHLPVTITRSNLRIQGSSMTYDHLSRVAQFKGRVRMTLEATGVAKSAPIRPAAAAAPRR